MHLPTQISDPTNPHATATDSECLPVAYIWETVEGFGLVTFLDERPAEVHDDVDEAMAACILEGWGICT